MKAWHSQKAWSEIFIVCWKLAFDRIWNEQLEMFIWSNSYSSKYLVLPILAEKQKTNIAYEYLS